MQVVMMDFKNWSSVPSTIDVIDNIHISITKPSRAFIKHYFPHKTWNYSIIEQIVVDNQERFIDVYVGLPRSLIDSHVLMKFKLYRCALHRNFFLYGCRFTRWIANFIYSKIKGTHYVIGSWHHTKKMENIIKFQIDYCIIKNTKGRF